MATGLAHEIRNPLGSISLFASLLERDLDDCSNEVALVRKIQNGVRNLDDIVSDVLAFARPDVMDRRHVRICEVVSSAIGLADPRFQKDGVAVELTNLSRDIVILADAGQLQRALLNLLLNAAEACDAGGFVRVSGRRINDEAVEIHVADDGPGIEPEVMDRIFNPFFTTKDSGTGLGLAIVHRIVESHGGTIRAGNMPGGGAAFSIRLPLNNGDGDLGREV
jgi:signal transduction histidine kinase